MGSILRLLAKRQQRLSWMLLALGISLLLALMLPSTPWAGNAPSVFLEFFLFSYFLVTLGIVITAIGVLSAANAKKLTIVVCSIAILLPPASLLAFLVIETLAGRRLREAGLRVRFMGVKDEEVVRVLCSYLCRQCGYDLTGNVSGRCPECGTPVPAPIRSSSSTA